MSLRFAEVQILSDTEPKNKAAWLIMSDDDGVGDDENGDEEVIKLK